MLHRNKKDKDIHNGKWNGLGGKLEQGETPEAGVIREVQEESGLTIVKPILAGILTWPMFDGKQDWYAFAYRATEFSGELTDDCPEGTLEWIPNERVCSLKLWEGDYIFLPWILQRRFFSAKFDYVEGILKEHSVAFYPQIDAVR